MSNASRHSHPAYASNNFEVTGEHGNTLTAQSGFRTVESGINCSGIGTDEAAEHAILLTAFSGLGVGLSVGEMYGLKCKIIAPNLPRPPYFIHEMSHHVHVGNAETFPGNLIDNTAISSTGIITEKRIEMEVAHGGKPTIVSIIRHTDWNPMTSTNIEFNIEYWCRPVRNLLKTQNLFQRGREVTINGFITGYDRTRHMIQVDIMAISVCSGPENINNSNPGPGTAESRTTRGGRVRLPRLAEILALTQQSVIPPMGATARAATQPPPDGRFAASSPAKRAKNST
ncbi:uncharacterized protein MELLADRAFT_61328 [Melampsora larici-populina 98AG31]|uniref:Uncharacterized protein n=1 Tax=Melampsora larici-populina (strain 98AG31 / pathotype 3-4-7) TaxID=747676 RepID=F4REG5_MELLP|nr:uncharacterized protein MELLADRAFT_61328 [Melampsora larici-populina 98AG31]EGG09087.1 hypothetical protein MELLADRAFT_61328 [Melampsora larici-populina 98AG31]